MLAGRAEIPRRLSIKVWGATGLEWTESKFRAIGKGKRRDDATWMRPCSGEISHGYVASRIHEMDVRNQGEDDTNQIRKVVTANFQVRD